MARLSFILWFCILVSCGDKVSQNPLERILDSAPAIVQDVIDQKDRYDVQIRYTQIDRDSLNHPTFTSYEFNVDESRYFYPASTVKMPTAFLAMEFINDLKDSLGLEDLDVWTPIEIDALRDKQTVVQGDSTSESGHASVAHYVKKIFAVSDNDAYNRLYELMGRAYINDRLKAKGFEGININHRLSLAGIDNRYTPSVRLKEGGKVIYNQPEKFDNQDRPNQLDNLIKGKGYIDIDDELVNEPFDFTNKNAFSIKALENVLKSVLFPQSAPESSRFNLTPDDYAYIYKCMSILPQESTYPQYDQWDSYVKFFMFGDNQDPMPDQIRIFNKVGDAYGYLTDCAYIVDFDNRVDFLLAATISVNDNEIYNDGLYEYDETGFPFMAELGKAVYEYELKRDKKYRPDLGKHVIDHFERLNFSSQ